MFQARNSKYICFVMDQSAIYFCLVTVLVQNLFQFFSLRLQDPIIFFAVAYVREQTAVVVVASGRFLYLL